MESCEIRRPGTRSRVGVNISKKWRKVNRAAQLAQRSFTILARFVLREIHRLASDVIIYIYIYIYIYIISASDWAQNLRYFIFSNCWLQLIAPFFCPVTPRCFRHRSLLILCSNKRLLVSESDSEARGHSLHCTACLGKTLRSQWRYSPRNTHGTNKITWVTCGTLKCRWWTSIPSMLGRHAILSKLIAWRPNSTATPNSNRVR